MFFDTHVPELCSSEQTCVGLGLELLNQLNEKFPELKDSLRLASCEESVDDLSNYILTHPSEFNETEKEHVLVAVSVVIGANKRRGVLLLDPGYHVARAVTVMGDKKYPHTGWFTQTQEPWVKKEYRYSFANNSKLDYVVWDVKETRAGGKITFTRSLVYVKAPYLTPVSVTEKRNLIYNYRSWLARSTKGEVIAGIHFPLMGLTNSVAEYEKSNGCTATIIYTDNIGVKQRGKVRMEHVLNEVLNVSEYDMLEACGQQLGLQETGTFLQILRKVAVILEDVQFLKQVLEINESLNVLG